MTKKRIMAIVICSPIILTVLALMALTAFVGYAATGKWELKQMMRQWAN